MNFEWIKEKLGSRKFGLVLLAIGGYLLLAVSGQMSFEEAFDSAKSVVQLWIVIEGGIDIARNLNHK